MLNLAISSFNALLSRNFSDVGNLTVMSMEIGKFRTFADCISQKQNFESPESGRSWRPLNVEVTRQSS
jgi:hypothetical protein